MSDNRNDKFTNPLRLDGVDDGSDMRVTLDLDDGVVEECEILTIFDLNGQNYIVLLPLDETDEPNPDGKVYIYRYFEDEDGNPSLENIEDDDEFEAVSDRFDELLDEAEFEEEEGEYDEEGEDA